MLHRVPNFVQNAIPLYCVAETIYSLVPVASNLLYFPGACIVVGGLVMDILAVIHPRITLDTHHYSF